MAEQRGLGSSREIELVGDDVSLPWRIFRPAQLNAYRTFEHRLMRSPLVHILVSDTFQRHISRHLRPLTRRLRGDHLVGIWIRRRSRDDVLKLEEKGKIGD